METDSETEQEGGREGKKEGKRPSQRRKLCTATKAKGGECFKKE